MLKQLTSVSLLLAACGLAQGQSFVEGFNSVGGVPAPAGTGPIPANWTSVNVSPGGPGGVPNWLVRMNPGAPVFDSQEGDGYVQINYNSSTGNNTNDTWLISPVVTWSNGDTITFWTRTADRNTGTGTLDYPDRMQVRITTTTTTIGSTQAGLEADFAVLLLDVNPTLSNNPNPGPPTGSPGTVAGFPDTWTQYTLTISGLSGSSQGRLAFRQFIPNGGPLSTVSANFFGIDDVHYTAGGGGGNTCYANCDNSTIAPCLNVNDFTCFLNSYGASSAYANCDASTIPPVLNVNDFTCFLNRYGQGCGANNCSPHP